MKKKKLTVFEPKHPFRTQNRRDTSEPLGNLYYQVFKVGFKGQSHMFGLSMFSIKQ